MVAEAQIKTGHLHIFGGQSGERATWLTANGAEICHRLASGSGGILMIKGKAGSIDPMRRQFLKTGVGGGLGLLATPLKTLASGAPKAEAIPGTTANDQPPSPCWTKDLIMYEFGTTQGFTSPNGPGSGTFGSMTAKLPYLQELGITGIWMDPPSLQDCQRFFYNMWCRYAVIEPDKFDPTLGTEEQFKTLIDEAHRRGIKIFLDIKTHGVMNYSPLVKKHPSWFRGSHWRMADYDWFGGHTDLDDWWVKIWSDCVRKYNVDGFRLDVDLYRPDLWERIRQNAPAGHPILIFEEWNSAIPGVTDFNQRDSVMLDDSGVLNEVMAQDIPGFYDRRYGRAGHYRVVITYADDGSRVEGSTDGQGPLRVHLDGLTSDKASRRRNDRSWYAQAIPDGIPDLQLTVENVASRPIENITVHDDISGFWQLYIVGEGSPLLAVEGEPPSLKLYLATLGHGWPEIQLSCHDQGWEGFPLDKSPYTAQGSRSLFGYSCLFAPAIPIFFSGEEFNATFRPLPWQSPHLYGGKDPGKGRWLYGCMLNWDELNEPEHRAMLEDVKKMITIRKRETGVFSMRPEKEKPNLLAVAFEGGMKVPVPYVRWDNESAIVIAANLNTSQDADLKLRIPLQEIGLAGRGRYRVTDLWPGSEAQTYDEKDLAALRCSVRRDKTPGGGLHVLKIEPNH